MLFARNLNLFEERISVNVPSDATVHDLITAICDQSGIPEDVIPSVTLNYGGIVLSPLETLADVGIGPEAEVVYDVRHHQFTVYLDYIYGIHRFLESHRNLLLL